MTFAGEECLLPFNQYTIITIFGDGEVLLRGTGLMGSRFESVSMTFSRDFYLKRSPLSPGNPVMDYDEPNATPFPIEGVSDGVVSRIHVEVWLAEEDFDGRLKPVKRVAKSRTIEVHLSCVDCMY
jgi:hypothetical protein